MQSLRTKGTEKDEKIPYRLMEEIMNIIKTT